MKNFFIQHKELNSEDYNFLEEITIKNFSLLDFLHGYCNYFSLALHNTYGYEVMNLYNYDKTLIHSFCIYKNNYIDIRGITSNLNEFLIDFEDWVTTDDFYYKPSDNIFIRIKDKNVYSTCEYIIREYDIYSCK